MSPARATVSQAPATEHAVLARRDPSGVSPSVIERPLATRLHAAKRPRPTLVGADRRRPDGPAAPATGGSGSFFRACILLLLRERHGHGYDLLERLTAFGFDSGDSGWLYRTLRAFEREQLVDSTWEISASGPPRRVYALTSDGASQLDAWADSIRDGHRAIEGFIGRHTASTKGGRDPD